MENKWILFKKDITYIPINDKNALIENERIVGGLNNDYKVMNGKIIAERFFPLDLNQVELSRLTYNDLFALKKKYFEDNGLKYSLFVYTLK